MSALHCELVSEANADCCFAAMSKRSLQESILCQENNLVKKVFSSRKYSCPISTK